MNGFSKYMQQVEIYIKTSKVVSKEAILKNFYPDLDADTLAIILRTLMQLHWIKGTFRATSGEVYYEWIA